MHLETTARSLGQQGELTAQYWCGRHELDVLATNQRAKDSLEEIDIIARDLTTSEIVFIEVKARSHTSMGWPEEAVNTSKQEKIRRVALEWLERQRIEHPGFGYPDLRFDVIALVGQPATGFAIKHYRGVF